MNKKYALKVENLTKIYSKKTSREVKALNNLNLVLCTFFLNPMY